MPDLPDAAVHAAAEAMLDGHDCEHLRADAYMERCFPCDARTALEAAAPALAEQIAAAIEAVDPVGWALAGVRAGQDAARIARTTYPKET